MIRQNLPTRLSMWIWASVLGCVALALVALTVADESTIGAEVEWSTTVVAVVVLVAFGVFLIFVERRTFVRIRGAGVEWRVPFVRHRALAWDEVDRFEIRRFWTRSQVVAVLRDDNGTDVLNPLDVAWVEQHVSRGWRAYQAQAVGLLNASLDARRSAGT